MNKKHSQRLSLVAVVVLVVLLGVVTAMTLKVSPSHSVAFADGWLQTGYEIEISNNGDPVGSITDEIWFEYGAGTAGGISATIYPSGMGPGDAITPDEIYYEQYVNSNWESFVGTPLHTGTYRKVYTYDEGGGAERIAEIVFEITPVPVIISMDETTFYYKGSAFSLTPTVGSPHDEYFTAVVNWDDEAPNMPGEYDYTLSLQLKPGKEAVLSDYVPSPASGSVEVLKRQLDYSTFQAELPYNGSPQNGITVKYEPLSTPEVDDPTIMTEANGYMPLDDVIVKINSFRWGGVGGDEKIYSGEIGDDYIVGVEIAEEYRDRYYFGIHTEPDPQDPMNMITVYDYDHYNSTQDIVKATVIPNAVALGGVLGSQYMVGEESAYSRLDGITDVTDRIVLSLSSLPGYEDGLSEHLTPSGDWEWALGEAHDDGEATDHGLSFEYVTTEAFPANTAEVGQHYTLRQWVTGNSNYDDSYIYLTFEVKKIPVYMRADDLEYNGADQTPDVTFYQYIIDENSFFKLSTSIVTNGTTAQRNVGEYALAGNFVGSSGDSYAFVAGDAGAIFHIYATTLTPDLTLASNSLVYGTAVGPTFDGVNLDDMAGEDDKVAQHVNENYYYRYSAEEPENAAAWDLIGWIEAPSGATFAEVKNVGFYQLKYDFVCDGYLDTYINYVSAGPSIVNVTVTKKALTITADNKDIVYGEAAPEWTITPSGFEYGETVSVLGGELAFACDYNTADPANRGANDYTITPSGYTSANYAITHTAGTLTVAKATLAVTVDADQTKVYGQADPALTFSVGASQFSDNIQNTSTFFNGALARVAGEPVGTYAISQGTLALKSAYSANYNISFTGDNFTITKATLAVTVDADQTKVYGQADPALTFSVGASQFSDNIQNTSTFFNGALARVAGEPVGTYAISQGTLALKSAYSANYNISFTGDNFTITKATLTVTVDADQSKTYGDDDPALTFSVGASQFSDNIQATSTYFNGALARVEGETYNALGYAISQGTLALKPAYADNYNISFTGNTFMINKLEVVISWSGITGFTVEYDGVRHALSAEVTNLVPGDELELEVFENGAKSVNSYTAYVELPDTETANNYQLSHENAHRTQAWSITAKDVSVNFTALTKVYTGSAQLPSYNLDGVIAGDSENVTLAFEGGNAIDVDEVDGYDKTFTLNGSKASNYNLVAGANYTVDAGVGTVNLKIARLEVTYTTALTGDGDGDLSVAYDGSSHTLSATITNKQTKDTVLDDVSIAISTHATETNAGEYVATLIFEGTRAFNYKFALGENTVTWNIAKIDAVITLAPAKVNGLVYNGENQALVTAGTVTGGTLYYSLDNDSWDDEVPTAFNANTSGYTVWYKVVPDGNHNAIDATSITSIVVSRKTATIKPNAGQTRVYGAGEPATFGYTIDGILPGDVDAYVTYAGNIIRAEGDNAGEYTYSNYTVCLYEGSTGDRHNNYDLTIDDVTNKFVITPKTVTYAKYYDGDIEKTTATYNGGQHTFNARVTNLEPGDTVTITVSGNGTNANTYNRTLTLGGADKNNYQFDGANMYGQLENVQFVIAKADYDMTGITFDSAELPYNGAAQSLTIEGELPEGEDHIQVTVNYSGSAMNVSQGAVLVTATFATTSTNYNVPNAMQAYVTITPIEYDMLGISFENAEVVYDGEAHSLTIEGDLPTGLDGISVTVNYSGEATHVNDGAVAVTATFSTTSANYNVPDPMEATITILPRPIRLAINDATSVYGNALANLSAEWVEDTQNGKMTIIGGDTLELDVNYSLTAYVPNPQEPLTSTSPVSDGYIIIGDDIDPDDDYEIYFWQGSYTLTARPITVVYDPLQEPKGATYGATAEWTALGEEMMTNGLYLSTTDGVANGEGLLGLLTITFTKAGDPTVYTEGDLDDELAAGTYQMVVVSNSANYNMTINLGEKAYLVVSPRALEVTITGATSVYGDAIAVPNVAITAGTLANEDANPWQLTAAYTALTNTTGVSSVAVLEATNANYAITFVGNTYSITKKDLTITADDKEVEYGAAVPTYTVSYEGFIEGDNESVLGGELAFACDYTTSTDAGNVLDIVPSGLTSANYDVTFIPGTITVNKRQVALVMFVDGQPIEGVAASVVYDGNNHTFEIKYQAVDSSWTLVQDMTIKNVADSDGTTLTPANNTLGNYRPNSTYSFTWNVTPKAITVSYEGEAQSRVFGDVASWTELLTAMEDNDYYLAVSPALGAGDTIWDVVEVAIVNGQQQPVEAGPTLVHGVYTLIATDLNNANYAVTMGDFTKATLTVTKNVYNMDGVTFAAITVTYDGQAHTAIAANLPDGVTATYELNSRTAVGTQTAIAHFTGDDDHEPIADKEAVITINPATLTGVSVAQNGALTYNRAEQAANVTTNATAVNNQAVTFMYSATENGTYTIAVPRFTTAGKHTIYYQASADNHNMATGHFDITIGKANYDMTDVTLANLTVTYDGEAHTIEITGELPFEEIAVTYDNETRTVAGSQTVTAHFAGDTANYNAIADKTATLTVKPKVITINVVAKSSTYGNEPAELTAEVADGDIVVGDEDKDIFSLACAVTAQSNVGKYNITGECLDGNYSIIFANGVNAYTVTEREITLTWSNLTFTYDGSAHKPTAVAGNLAGEDVLAVTVSGEATLAGTHTATAAIESVNYVLPEVITHDFTIAKAAAVFDLSRVEREFRYTGSELSISGATVSGGGAISYENNSFVTVGTHTVTVKSAESANYLAGSTTVDVVVKEAAPQTSEDGSKTYYKVIDVEEVKEEGVDVTAIFNDASADNAEAKEVKLEVGDSQIVFNAAAVAAIAGNEVTLKLEVSKDAEDAPKGAQLVIDVKLEGATFAEGSALVSVPFDGKVPGGQQAKVYYVDENGKKTAMKTTLADGVITFETNHFSRYIVTYELTGGSIAGIVIAVVAVAAGAAVAVLFLLKKKKGNGPAKTDKQPEQPAEEPAQDETVANETAAEEPAAEPAAE